MTQIRKVIFLALCAAAFTTDVAAHRARTSFNAGWHLVAPGSDSVQVTLPRAWNEHEAYAMSLPEQSSGVAWYHKTFRLDSKEEGRVFIEFEGARQTADVWLNGHKLGVSENGVMAFAFDMTPYIIRDGDNHLAVRTENGWDMTERATGTKWQWNDKNFNLNMGGLPHNVWLHVTGGVYQTLPLYSNLRTTGVYVYGTDYDIKGKRVTCNVESQVINSTKAPARVRLTVEVTDRQTGKAVARFKGGTETIAAGDTITLKARRNLAGIHFWSWGYGYLYDVRTSLDINGRATDEVTTTTGFRKTQFGNGRIWLNDRVMMVHGYAQRTSNEWPAVGIDVPAWMSDYSNDLLVKSGGNVVRWMHVCPSKQEVESCDRVGLIQAMPAGDAEKDRQGRQWEMRTEVMRDAIIYNRNNPSILFYESGNESVSREHIIEMKRIRDRYDPNGGRAMGSREMLDIDEAEYGGEMLYINKSKKHPMWAMEYCRDEGYRMYWDEYSYPYHRQGAGPLYRKQPAEIYNQNQDQFTIEQICRWHDYYTCRPGMGDRVSSGGVKIIFSDTNTHGRSEMNYRVSGVVDAMRIPKDSYFANQVMWDSWCEVQHKRSYIIGHWNYPEGVVKDVYAVSTSPVVRLFLNDSLVGTSTKAQYDFLHTIPQVEWRPGRLVAIGYAADGTTEESRYEIQTAGKADHLRLTVMQAPGGLRADGADIAIIQVEVVDKDGRRCPVDNRMINWRHTGPVEWLGGCTKSGDLDNYILSESLPVECGVGRVMIRSTPEAGDITVTAECRGLESRSVALSSHKGDAPCLPSRLDRGETPAEPSYTVHKTTVPIIGATAGANSQTAAMSYDDNELSEWANDGTLRNAWITYSLKPNSRIDEISLKLTGWRMRNYPIAIELDGKEVWRGTTEKSLGYVYITLPHTMTASTLTVRQTGQTEDGTRTTSDSKFDQIVEVAEPSAGELDLFKAKDGDKVRGELRIVEIDILKHQ